MVMLMMMMMVGGSYDDIALLNNKKTEFQPKNVMDLLRGFPVWIKPRQVEWRFPVVKYKTDKFFRECE